MHNKRILQICGWKRQCLQIYTSLLCLGQLWVMSRHAALPNFSVQSDKARTKKSKLWPRLWLTLSFRPCISRKLSTVTALRLTKRWEIHKGSASLNTFLMEWGPVKDKLPTLRLHRHRPLFAMHALAWVWFSRWKSMASHAYGEKNVWWQLDFIARCNIAEMENRLSLTLFSLNSWANPP